MRSSHFLRFQVAVWPLYAVFIFPAKLAAEKSFSGALAAFAIHDGISIALTVCLGTAYDRIYQRHDELLWLGSALVLFCICGGLIQVAMYWLVGDIFPSEHLTIFGESVSLGIFYYRFGLLLCWSLIYLVLKRQREEAGRELRMLRAQMNPHLLSNAMVHIIDEVQLVAPKAANMVQSLMNYCNYSLRHQKDDFVTMGEEYDALMDFLKLEKSLFGSKVDIACQIEESIRSAKVPGVILQPLVENAVKYGLQTQQPPVWVRMEIKRRDSLLTIEVCNTGRWVKEDHDRTSGGLGLSNIRRRLSHVYGRKYRFETFEEEGWVTVRITIPAKL